MSLSPTPPLTSRGDVDAQLASAGFAVLDAATLRAEVGVPDGTFEAWSPHWDDLGADDYLRDDGDYRRRRHGAFIVNGEAVTAVAHRPHWQPLDYNALHGGIERWFEPLPEGLAADPAWRGMIRALAGRAEAMRDGSGPWYVETHPFRIDASSGIGRPTPEGAHRDGVDLVAVILVSRENIKGGETRVFDFRGPHGMRFTMSEPWSALILDDERVIHESTPIQPREPGAPAHRDTLVVTVRRGGFQGPA